MVTPSNTQTDRRTGPRRVRLRVPAAVALALVSAAVLGGPGRAQELSDGDEASAPVVATLTGTTGYRAVSVVTGAAGATNVSLSGDLGSTLTGTFAVTVVEAARQGTATWSVQAQLCAPSSVDCSVNRLEQTGGSGVIDAANVSVTGGSVTQTASGGSAAALSSPGTLDSPVTLFTVTGQDPGLLYTGSWAFTGTLALAAPDNVVPGTYTGTLRVTLVQ